MLFKMAQRDEKQVIYFHKISSVTTKVLVYKLFTEVKKFLIWYYLKNFPNCFNQSDYFERKQQQINKQDSLCWSKNL